MHKPVTACRRRPRSMPAPEMLHSLVDSGVIAGAAVCGLTALYFGAHIVGWLVR